MNQFQEFFLKAQRSAHRKAARIERDGRFATWRMKLRVRLGARLGSEADEMKVKLLGRTVTLKSRTRGRTLAESEWVVLSASRFPTAEAAVTYGADLQTAVSVAGALGTFPVDVGVENSATSTMGDIIRGVIEKEGSQLLDDVHGIDAYPSWKSTKIMFAEGTVTVQQNPDIFVGLINSAGRKGHKLDDAGKSAALLLNAAAMANHHLAKLALSVSAVELISATEKWNSDQKAWIRDTRKRLLAEEHLSTQEREELSNAMDGLFNFGALEKTRRLIKKLGKYDLIERWNKLYQGRSSLFHGSRYLSSAEILEVAGEASQVCKEIVDAYITAQIGAVRFDVKSPVQAD